MLHFRSDEESVETYDAVLLCSGHHVEPYVLSFPNQETFTGNILHSHSYKSHVGYEDKRVVVVGVENSGGDVAVELSRIAAQVGFYVISYFCYLYSTIFTLNTVNWRHTMKCEKFVQQ